MFKSNIFSSKVQFRKISQKWQLVNERKSLNFCYLRKPLGLKKDLWLWHTYQLRGTEICLFRHSGTTSMQDSVDIGPVSPNSSRQVGKEILLNVFIGIDMPWFPTLINLTPCWFQAKLSIRVSPKQPLLCFRHKIDFFRPVDKWELNSERRNLSKVSNDRHQ